jgi:signal transduction histidine kinase
MWLSKNLNPEFQINSDDLLAPLDLNLIEQVLINLIKNASEALEGTEKPAILIEAGTITESSLISITDNGPGIEPELMDEIFVPFFSTKEEGSGIGLSLSRQIMRLHGGSISIQSSPGFSTTFTLTFKPVNKIQ